MALFTPGLNGRRGLPYILVGEPGTVKTSAIYKLAQLAGLPCEVVVCSLRQAQDFIGLAVPRREKLTRATQHLSQDGDSDILYADYAPSGFAIRAAKAKRSLIFLDEANTATPETQAAMLRFVLEGVVGELDLGPDVRVMLAMNAAKDTSGAWDISPAMANRFGWLEWKGVTARQFGAYLSASGGRKKVVCDSAPVNAALLEAKVDAQWPAAWASAAGAIAGFLESHGSLLHKMPPDGVAAGPWPSARSWDFAAHALAGSIIFNLTVTERNEACAGAVGVAAWMEFSSWLVNADLPNAVDVLEGRVVFTASKQRMDRTAAVFGAMTAIVLGSSEDEQQRLAAAMWGILSSVTDSTPGTRDLAVRSVVALSQAGLMIGNKTAYKFLSTLAPIAEASGVTLSNMR